MTLLGFKTILHKECRCGKYSEGPAEKFLGAGPISSKMKTNFKKSDNQYFPESSSICNIGITRIFQYLQYWYNQYFPESSGICNTHILAMTSIFQYCRYWKILEDTGKLVFTSIVAGCFILSSKINVFLSKYMQMSLK